MISRSRLQRPVRRGSTIALASGLMVLGPSAAGHHSFSMFDRDEVVERTVEVKEFQWTNPHTWIQVYIDAADGGRDEWSIEGGGRNSLARSGWRPSTFAPGDVVVLRFNPMRDGSHGGAFVGARLADGSTIGEWEDEL